MNAITETPAVSAKTLEHVLGTGDLSQLTTEQRVEYYARTCQSLGLNPLTRPFRFLKLNNQTVLYATRDCTDQLRKVHGITLHIVDKTIDEDLFLVTVRARTKDGREDEDMAAVTLGRLQGESRANALMKAMTKAKRRVTLSICGLGLTDESELDTMPGAQVFDADAEPPPVSERRTAINTSVPLVVDELPPVPIRAAAKPIQRAPRIAEPMTGNGERTDDQWRRWLDKLRLALSVLRDAKAVEEVANRDTITDAMVTAPAWVKREITAVLAEAYARFSEQAPDDEPPESEDMP